MVRHLVSWSILAVMLAALVSVVMTCPPQPVPFPRKDLKIKPGTKEKPVCNNNQWDPPPEGAICGGQGWLLDPIKKWGFIKDQTDFYWGPNECYKSCFKKRTHAGDCKIFAVWPGLRCEKYEKKIPRDRLENSTTAFRWYEPKCFCNITKDWIE
ncbi:hypothetical protein FPOA_06839 [Fusarium poae]|uniref:Apple domain-containing protein n=1 Tax=Fusarium poae TaxID=36050 RepID=A0A1B8AJC0_FUSPO|nr:hypothetical protein FPOA_06839 [Fusarium poae]